VEVSADTSAGRYSQKEPVVARFDSGRFGVFWLDQSEGDFQIFGRRFDRDLAAAGSVQPLFSDHLTRTPAEFAASGDGRDMMLAWVDRPLAHAFYAVLDTALQRKVSVPLDETPEAEYVGSPVVAARRPRGFVAAWEEFRGGYHIFAQRVDSNGAKVGVNFNVDQGPDTILHLTPAAAGDTTGGFLISWIAGDAGRSDVYVRIYNAAGAPVAAALRLTQPQGTEAYLLPAAVYVRELDEYWVTYIRADVPADSTALFMRRVTRASTLADSAAALAAGPYPWAPGFTRVSNRIWILTERFDNAADVRRLALDLSAAIADSSATVNAPAFNERLSASVSERGDTALAVWQDRRSGGDDIRGRLVAASGFVSPDSFLSTETQGGQQTSAALATRSGGGVRVFMHDTQNDAGDITMAGVREDGSADERLLVNDDGTSALQFDPAASSDSTGRGLVVWTDERGDWTGPARHVAGRFVAASGGFLGPAFIVPAVNTAIVQGEPDVALARGGEAAVVWSDDRTGTARTYMRIFAPDRSPLTGDLALNDGTHPSIIVAAESAPAVSIDSVGRVWAAWSVRDVLTDSFFVLARSYTIAGVPRSATLDMSPAGKTPAALAFDIVARPDGRALIVWVDPGALQRGILARPFDSTGTSAGGAFRVSDSGVAVRSPAVWADLAGLWAAAWSEQNGTDQDILWRRFDAADLPVDTIVRISPSAPARLREKPAIITAGLYLYGAWPDNQDAGQGFDIRLSSELYKPSAVRGDDDVLPDAFELFANYPNPFNPETVIEYALDWPAPVTLTVYDVLGRHVRTLERTNHAPGRYRARWDGTDASGRLVASGVYFYQLRAGALVQTRKMLLVR
jgi:hypothetical protein